ncbi:MAG: glycoside hydrolase [Cyanobacteria bacterium NC_groundwater_1444_Ag_S-0.65um_54_12]|nr:glycoside hydrolase [Cyanobacteria bacterium NC_groundwater_1444_Ag_S-0.65um_54_12]
MIYVAFIWHMHQPLYKDRLTGRYLMPWVRLHGIKDYLDTIAILRQYPKLQQTFNLVPSLLEQIEDYAQGRALDRTLELTLKPVPAWNADDRIFVMERFFDAQWDHMIVPFPRYYQLATKRRDLLTQFTPLEASRAFTYQDLSDLTVWFNLAWFDPLWQRTEPAIAELIQRGQGFTQADRETLVAIQRQILGRIIPEYSAMQTAGQLELTTTPFYHPILPLLIDTHSARIARPQLPLPNSPFRYPEDARRQIQRGFEYFAARFGHRPSGMWPSEQAISPAVLQLLVEERVKWAVSDEGILAQSLGTRLVRDAKGQLLDPEILYRPYTAPTAAGNITLIFRDVVLSDLIGFSYSRVPGAQAARDLHERLCAIEQRCQHSNPLVTIALDGENCWEHYAEDGWEFLRNFYDTVSDDPKICLTTVSGYLAKYPAKEILTDIHSGSWIGSDFTTWIGDPVKNRAWDLLLQTRQALENYSGPEAASALEELLIAEGSDWFWWFGEGHDSGQDELFDQQFRLHLRNAYQLMNLKVPKEIDRPVEKSVATSLVAPSFGAFDPTSGQGTMHATARTIGRIEYGCDGRRLNFVVEFSSRFAPSEQDEVLIYLCYPGQTRHNSPLNARPAAELKGVTSSFLFAHEIRIGFSPLAAVLSEAGEVFTWHALPINLSVSCREALKVDLPVAALGQGPGRELHFVVVVCQNGNLLEVLPRNHTLGLRIPHSKKATAILTWQGAPYGE